MRNSYHREDAPYLTKTQLLRLHKAIKIYFSDMNMKNFKIYYSVLFSYSDNTSRFILSDRFIFVSLDL